MVKSDGEHLRFIVHEIENQGKESTFKAPSDRRKELLVHT